MANKRGKRKQTLTDRQKVFVLEYLIDHNATQAAMRAGYKPNSAMVTGHALLQKPHIAAEIAKAQAARARRINISADRVLLELARVGLGNIRNMCSWDRHGVVFIPSEDLAEDDAACVSAVKCRTTTHIEPDGSRQIRHDVELKLWDKVKALKEMGKHLGVSEKIDLTMHDEMVDMTTEEIAKHAIKLATEALKEGE